MDEVSKCPKCHIEVRPTDYFCFNCGKNLKPKPPSTSVMAQIILYLESFFLPPYGTIIGMRYLQHKDKKSKIVGVISIVLTVLSLVVFAKVTRDLMNTVNAQISKQLRFSGY